METKKKLRRDTLHKVKEMRVFVNKQSGKRWYVLDYSVREGDDAYYLKGYNISLPKPDWKEEE